MIAILQLQLLEVWVVAGWTEAGGGGEATEASWRTTNFPRNEFEIFSGSRFQYSQKYWRRQNDDQFEENPKYFGDTFDCRCVHPTEKSEQEQDRGKGAVVD